MSVSLLVSLCLISSIDREDFALCEPKKSLSSAKIEKRLYFNYMEARNLAISKQKNLVVFKNFPEKSDLSNYPEENWVRIYLLKQEQDKFWESFPNNISAYYYYNNELFRQKRIIQQSSECRT